MKLVSKQHDYYDSMFRFSQGDKDIFLRTYREVEMNGTFSKNTTTTITTPLTCNTQDNINCTALVTGTTCFTQDNKTCTAASATTGVPITLNLTINCEAKSVIPN
jgi:hypothetical protein